MSKQEFLHQNKFFFISVIIFALVCLLAFWPKFTQKRAEKAAEAEIEEEIATVDNNISETEGDSMSSDLLIEDLVEGTGEPVKAGDTISIHYHGTLEDGTVFDSSVERNEPFVTQIGVGSLIQGWEQGIPGMKIGGKRRLTIPPSLGYGSQAVGSIPANSTLIFEVELLDIK